MSLSIRQLKYFVATAELGQVSQAAIQLSISQSAVTTAIKELETEVGGALFVRTNSGMELTEAGRKFLGHAYTILSAVDEALRVPTADSRLDGTLSVATTYTVLGYFLPYHLQRFSQLYPRITVNVYELSRDAIEEGLLGNRFDMAVLLTSNLVSPELASETFFGSQRRLWVSARHPLLELPEVTLSDVAREPYIMLTVDEAAQTALRYWGRTPFQPNIRLRTTSVEAVRSMVANGWGVSILSDMVYRPWSLEGKRIETVNLKDAIPAMTVGLAWRKGADLAPTMSAFRDYFRQIFLEPSFSGGGRVRGM
jgi:DNA-binding transcriptional LysR family regulator